MRTLTTKKLAVLCLPFLAATAGLYASTATGSAESRPVAASSGEQRVHSEQAASGVSQKQSLQSGKLARRHPPRHLHGNDLNQKIIAHTDTAKVRDLIHFLAPHGWRVRFDVAASKLDRALVFHAETTRRNALDQLCSGLGLKGIFYPRKRLVLIVEGRPS